MENMKPISALENYESIINEVSYGNPVYLMKDGHCPFAIVDGKELDELKAIKSLFSELGKGEVSGSKKDYLSLEESKIQLTGTHLNSDG